MASQNTLPILFAHLRDALTGGCGRVQRHFTESNLRANPKTFLRSLLAAPCTAALERSRAQTLALPKCGQISHSLRKPSDYRKKYLHGMSFGETRALVTLQLKPLDFKAPRKS